MLNQKVCETPKVRVGRPKAAPGSGIVSHRQINVQAALTTSAAATLARAIISPPIAGPTTVAISNMLEFQVTALLNKYLGTSCGSIADRAGRANAKATELSSTIP